MQIRIPIEYILRVTQPTWSDLRFGLERGFIDEVDVVKAAVEQVKQVSDHSDAEVELAGLDQSNVNWNYVTNLLNDLAVRSDTTNPIVERKWLYLVLAWIYSQKELLHDPLGMVEEVYADFGYPEEIAGFVRYMPPSDTYSPQDHSYEENISRLFQLWNEYLVTYSEKE
jgi:hypothetical protein